MNFTGRDNDSGNSSEFSITKYILLAALFLVTVVATFISMNFQKIQPSATSMSESSLPTVGFLTDEGTEYNILRGYTTEMDDNLFCETLTAVNTSKKLPIVIHTYGADVQTVAYRIRNLENGELIENTNITSFEKNGNDINVVCNIKNLIDANTEYSFEVNLSTAEHEAINYYTRIITGKDYNLQDKIDFVLDFNACTFDSTRLKEISTYLETSQAGDNTNYGKVNINCSLSQVGWGSLNPQIESEIIPTVQSVDENIAIICLDYQIGAENDYGSYDTYRVNEYYRIRQTYNGFYLLNYEREANQVFDAKNDLTSSSKINLGINSETTAQVASDTAGVYTYFVTQGNLWCFNASSETFTKVFSFEESDSDGIRDGYQNHSIKIMNVQDNGSCQFLITGYMNRGAHEGEVGISLCIYDYPDNDVTEQVYIPSKVPYDVLSQNSGGVSYVTGDKFYILIDETLYSIDLVSKEIMIEIDGLKEGTYAVSEAGDAIAYSTNGEIYNTDRIRVLNMSNNTDYEIKAEEGDVLLTLGYIKSDLIYGIAHKSDILKKDNGSEVFAMYKIGVMDKDYNLLKEYSEEGIYVSGATVDGMRITLTRMEKSDDGYSTTTIDQLINKDENVVENEVACETISTTTRKQELFIDLIKTVENIQCTYRTSRELTFKDDSKVETDEEFKCDGLYYVYGYGKFQGSYLKLENAVDKAYETYGSVLDDSYRLIWKRYKSSSASIEGIASSGCDSSETLEYAVSMLVNYIGKETDTFTLMNQGVTAVDVLNSIDGIRGIILSNEELAKALSYVGSNSPVIGKIGVDSYVVIKGYDSSSVTYIDVETGKEITKTMTEANKLFAQGGNVFISYVKL